MPAHKKAANTARTENVSVRLDPKIHYLASLASRESPSRSVSGFIEWAVRRTLTDAAAMVANGEPMPGSWPTPAAPLWGEVFWDVDESDRFFKLATMAYGLLTVPEQRLWKFFNMHIAHTNQTLSVEAFREFWNDSSINTSHLKDGD